jgi:8-oxo-dGTP pyrophosphatase MutT (NUDIX family)
VKCLVEYEGRFAVIKIAYAHRNWTFPGGGVKKNETFAEAALRETREETGIALDIVTKIGGYRSDYEGKDDTVEIFFAKAKTDEFNFDPLEVSECKWLTFDEMKEQNVRRIREIGESYENARKACII